MKIIIVISVLLGFGTVSSASSVYQHTNEPTFIEDDSTSLGPVLQLILECPVDLKKLDSLKITTTIIETAPDGFGMNYLYELEENQLGERIGKRLGHRDSPWPFGMSNWRFQSFSTSSPELPLLLGLTVGSNIEGIIKRFGQPSNSDESELIYDYIKESGLRLIIGVDNSLITKIYITKHH
ncbi:MAG: hypothetical protein HRT58_21085 [Crocinitomicaceae bacterium]|nr:hypothetical protein [Flavobacteriales bacterium]NQZ38167.1 hypothetical protein [Crocinitomicaceae bacterium]